MSSSGKGFQFNDGDWTCPECSNVNFARRSQCNRCGAERKYEIKKIKKGGIEIGKSAADKSKGLFSADDWMCKTCGNVNWARRSDCNMCNTPKVDIQDERTGFGGGFNERAGVEYKDKDDSSDGEFDEFGRKKKKFRGKIQVPKVNKQSDNEKDDEEESGSDEDVSKYDLEADEEDDADTGKYDLAASEDEEETKSKSKSHSRSRSQSNPRKNNGKKNTRSRSRSNSRSRRRRRSSSSSNHDDRRHMHRHHRHKKSRSRSRSPHRRHRHSSSGDRHKHRR